MRSEPPSNDVGQNIPVVSRRIRARAARPAFLAPPTVRGSQAHDAIKAACGLQRFYIARRSPDYNSHRRPRTCFYNKRFSQQTTTINVDRDTQLSPRAAAAEQGATSPAAVHALFRIFFFTFEYYYITIIIYDNNTHAPPAQYERARARTNNAIIYIRRVRRNNCWASRDARFYLIKCVYTRLRFIYIYIHNTYYHINK